MSSHPPFSWHEDHRGVTLQCPYWTFRYDLPLGLFDLLSPAFPAFQVRWARARALYRRGTRLLSVGSDDGHVQDWQVGPVEGRMGPGLRLHVRCNSSRRPALEFAASLFRDSPFLVLELALHNTRPQEITVEALQPLEIDPQWGGKVTLGSPISGVYRAGWQSWSVAGWRQSTAREQRSYLGPLSGPMHDSSSLPPLLPGRFRADLVGVLTPLREGAALLCGLVSAADQFGALQVTLRGTRPDLTFTCFADGLPLAPGERVSSERVALLLAWPGENLLGVYGEALGQGMEGKTPVRAPRGWCSWTAFYRRLGEEDVLRQVEWLAGRRALLPVEVVQVDDGWEQAVGDWEANERFPHGMARLAEEIGRAGFVPGLWLAPFIVHPRSRLAAAHPEWLLRDENGRPASAGLGWGRMCHGLDVTRPDVQGWVRRLVSTVAEEWGYGYLKLDFLYAAALPARRYRPAFTRAQALRRGLEIVREAAGAERFLLGCGCPLGPAIGLVDAMRVSTDVALDWRPHQGALSPLLRGEPVYPAAANALRNSLTRAWTHRTLWLNDPDALVLRQGGSRLTGAEVRTLATVAALSGGTWMLGDDLPGLEAGRQPLAAVGLPVHAGRPWVPDLLAREQPREFVLELERSWGQGWLVALINWEDRPAGLEFDLAALGLPPDRRCHLHEFWGSEYRRVQGRVRFAGVEPHGCRTFLVRPVQDEPQWVGSTLHIVQGEEVGAWAGRPTGASLTLDAGRAAAGSLLLWLPGVASPRVSIRRKGVEASLEPVEEGVWRVRLRAGEAGSFQVRVAKDQPGSTDGVSRAGERARRSSAASR